MFSELSQFRLQLLPSPRDQGSQTGQEVIFDLFFCALIFENLAGIEKYLYRFCEFIGCNFIFFKTSFPEKMQPIFF